MPMAMIPTCLAAKDISVALTVAVGSGTDSLTCAPPVACVHETTQIGFSTGSIDCPTPPSSGPRTPLSSSSYPELSSSTPGILVDTASTFISTAITSTVQVLTTRPPTTSSSSTSLMNIINLSPGPSTSSFSSNQLSFTTLSNNSPVLAASKHDIPVGTIVGSVFGAMSLIMLLAIGLIFWRQRVKRRRDERDLAVAFSSSPDMAFNDRSFLYSDTSRYAGYSQAGTSTPPRRAPYSDVDRESSGADMATSAGFEEAGYNAGIATDESRPPSYPAAGHGYGRQVYGDQRTSFSGVPQSAHEGDDEEEAEEKYPEEKSPEMMRELERELQFRYD